MFRPRFSKEIAAVSCLITSVGVILVFLPVVESWALINMFID